MLRQAAAIESHRRQLASPAGSWRHRRIASSAGANKYGVCGTPTLPMLDRPGVVSPIKGFSPDQEAGLGHRRQNLCCA